MMDLIDAIHLDHPYYGARKIAAEIRRRGHKADRKRIGRLMKEMRIEARYCKPRTSKVGTPSQKYPYLLRGLLVTRVNQVWQTDITYIRVAKGYLFLMAIIDVYSRKIVSWGLSNTMDLKFCCGVLRDALRHAQPEIGNTDQGSQFTSDDFVQIWLDHHVKVSWDGIRRAIDNIFIERFWRSLKYEHVYIYRPETGEEAYRGIKNYIEQYDNIRLHESLEYNTPSDIYFGRVELKAAVKIK